MKNCSTCGELKDLDAYYGDNRATDGKQSSCAACRRAYSRKHFALPETKAKRRAYWQTPSGKLSKKTGRDKYNAANQEKVKARKRLQYEVKKGRVKKLPCKVCGCECVEAHHANGYDKENELDVIWLCKKHHFEEHEKD